MRIIQLEPGEKIPECQMDSRVIFLALEGKVAVTVNGERVGLGERQVIVAEPGLLAMEGITRSWLLGIQIKPFDREE
ncbi:MAG: hypothetical protein H5U06_09530 [Candidatus Aminicenantes bacterium]|nr:hypothetical protein [Candidatus Aminicenantes bacterium]